MMLRVVGTGWVTLLQKELLRFWKVSFQTIAAPVLTALLYLLIFSHVLETRVTVFDGQVRYTAFLIPGLVMMSVLQNSFANASSSLIQSKVTGNLIFVLLPPLSPLDMYAAYVLGAMVRGLAVGLGVFIVTLLMLPGPFSMAHPVWALGFARAGQRDPRHARDHRGHLGRQVRRACRVPEFPDRAAHVPFRRVLFDPYAAAVLAGAVAFQPVLLYDRRVSLWVFRAVGRGAGAQPRAGCVRSRRAGRAGTDDSFARLEIETLTFARREMVTAESIKSSIESGMACDVVEVTGDGHHFEALIVSGAFRGLPRIARHRLVYAALGDRMREEVHALSMTTQTPEERGVS